MLSPGPPERLPGVEPGGGLQAFFVVEVPLWASPSMALQRT